MMTKSAILFTVAAADMSWEEYKNQFGKVYNGGDEEDQQKQQVFESNKAQWGQHESGAILGATVFSDLTLEEFQQLDIRGFSGSAAQGLPKVGVHEFRGETLAASVDWTTKGAVTPVKDQGQCGSCWAFSTTGGLEGAWQLASGNLASLSEQQFVDCSKANSGCNGGLMDTAFEFAETTAIVSEESYPYTAKSGLFSRCKTDGTTVIAQGGVTGYKDVSNSASSLQSALNSNPVSVAIQADQSVFQQYTGGVISSGCGSSLDHGVLAVGYDGSTIKVKNSWGASWGVNGYVSIDASQCGITTSASYPTVSASVASKATAGSCSADDQAVIQAMDDNDFGDASNKCGTGAYNIITGKLNGDKFKSCLKETVAIADSCADCYVATAQYGASNCKAACLLGWCKQGCLDCTAPAQTNLATCTGFAAGSPKPCLKSTAGSCSADDQSKLSDSPTVGKAGSDCGLKSYNVLTGNFNHDTFNSCFTEKLSIASGCSECYATNGEFAAKNCKAACLLGWCKQGCLDCSTAAEPKAALDSCTGFTSGSADPCLEEIAV